MGALCTDSAVIWQQKLFPVHNSATPGLMRALWFGLPLLLDAHNMLSMP